MEEIELFRAGFIELEVELRNNTIEYMYIEVKLKDPNDIFKLRKVEGLKTSEAMERIRARREQRENASKNAALQSQTDNN